MTALVVHSGGLDSTVALCWAEKQYGRAETITFDYGQRHRSELQAAKTIADYLNVNHLEVEVPLGTGGVLTTDEEMPHMTYDELAKTVGPSLTYVPYRNGTFLSIATSLALEYGHDTIVAGMHAEDAHNWAYPDCTPEFIGAMQNAIHVGTYFKVRLVCPFTYMEKWEIVKLGAKLHAPLDLTLSCYEGTVPACGKCPTCIARLEAFRKAGILDPLDYASVPAIHLATVEEDGA